MRAKITKRAVASLKPRARRYLLWDTEVTGFGCKTMPSGNKIYVFQYRLPGRGRSITPKRIRIGRHGELTADQARKIAATMLVEVKAGGDPATALRPHTAPTVQALAERFLNEYLPNKKRPPRRSTIVYYESLFRCHIVPKLGALRVEELKPTDLESFHLSLRSKPYVANRALTVLQHALDQAEGWGWLSSRGNPARHVERYPEERRGARKEVMLTPEQMGALLKAVDEEEAAGTNPNACNAIRLAFWTGWRIGEVLRLEWDNVDLESGTTKLLMTKTAREEYRQLPAEAITVIRSTTRVAGCRYVFPGRDFSIHLTTVRKPWVRTRRRAGLDNLEDLGSLRLHDLRHNVVSWDVSRGVGLEVAGRNVGHRSRASTEVYAHFAPDALKRAADERAAAMRQAIEDSD